MQSAPISEPEVVKTFALAGNARVTLVSKTTGTRFTYRIQKTGDGQRYFIAVLTGSDNESDYTYMGLLGEHLRQTRGSKISETAPSYRAFQWFWENLQKNHIPNTMEIWHEGRCGRCNRPLTNPVSIASGIGPECRNKI